MNDEPMRRVPLQVDKHGLRRGQLSRAIEDLADAAVLQDRRRLLRQQRTEAVKQQLQRRIVDAGVGTASDASLAMELGADGRLVLRHDHASDGRGLDLARARRVLEYTRRVWRRPVRLLTVNERGEPVEIGA